MTTPAEDQLNFDYSKYGFRDEEQYVYKSEKGLSESVVRTISQMKGEPEWMLKRRLKALEIFNKKPLPVEGVWANPKLAELDFQDIFYYVRPGEKSQRSWDDVPENIKNTFERLGIPEAEQKFLAGVGAQYECLSGDTRVYTTSGMVPIRDIQPGDVVFSFDEETDKIIPAEVTATMEKGEREVLEVRVGTRVIKATSNHPFLALVYEKPEDRQRGRFTRMWKYLHELNEGDLVAVTKDLPDTGEPYELVQPAIKTTVVGRNQSVEYELDITSRYNQVTLPRYTTVDLMWWLGLYIGDGHIHYQKNADKARVEIAIHENDPELRAELTRVTERVFDITPTVPDNCRLSINSTIVARFLEANHFIGKALEKRVPRWVYELPLEQKLAFLGGYLDADGYVRDDEKNHDVMLTSGNRELLQDMTDLLALCGLPTSKIHEFQSKHPHDKDRFITGYRLQVSGDYQRIGSRSPRRLERMDKRKFYHNYSNSGGTTFRGHVNEFFGYVKIKSIKPAGVEMVYDIEVKGPHNFVAEGLIVHNSESVYHSLREEWEKQGVVFLDMDAGLREYPEIIKEYFGTIVPSADNKFAALNTAVWSGGSFVYVPKGVKVDIPLQAYFRINAENMGQFERTLIIVDEGGEVTYIEGCTAPVYTTNSLHSAVVEIIVKKDGKCRYTTIQNWAPNIFNLVTKRAVTYENAQMEWVDGNIGCLAEGSTVTTPNGIKPIEALEVGEKVLSYDDRTGELVFRPVVAKRYSGEQAVHTVAAGERMLRATSNHPFFSYAQDATNGEYRRAYVRTDHIQEVIVPALERAVGAAKPAMHTQLGLSDNLEVIKVNVSEASTELVPTWDIEVEDTGNFVSQGFIVHNSKLTMKYPAVYMMGRGSKGEVLSVAYAGEGQHQDAGAKMVHAAPDTTSRITNKSVSKGGGRTTYRGLARVEKGATNAKLNVVCDALILDDRSASDTIPYIEIEEDSATIAHEATVGKIGEEQLFYLMSRGLDEAEALSMIVLGFMEPFTRELPMEYAVELNRLIQMEMEGSVG